MNILDCINNNLNHPYEVKRKNYFEKLGFIMDQEMSQIPVV